MTYVSGQMVFLLVLGRERDSELETLASNRGWRVAGMVGAEQATRDVLEQQPQVVIIQFSERLNEALCLIGSLRRQRPHMPVIAVTPLYHSKVEQAVRSMGASCFFSGARIAGLVNEAVDAMVAKNTLSITVGEKA